VRRDHSTNGEVSATNEIGTMGEGGVPKAVDEQAVIYQIITAAPASRSYV
jgi:hypothetical protein